MTLVWQLPTIDHESLVAEKSFLYGWKHVLAACDSSPLYDIITSIARDPVLVAALYAAILFMLMPETISADAVTFRGAQQTEDCLIQLQQGSFTHAEL